MALKIFEKLESTPRTMSLHYFVGLLVSARWLAGIGALSIIALCQFVLLLDLPYAVLYPLAASVLLYNVVFLYFLRSTKAKEDEARSWQSASPTIHRQVRLALVQIILDLLVLFGLLSHSGGLTNPFVLFTVFHVVIAGILLAPRTVITVTTFASVLVFGLGVGERLGILPHYSLGLLGDARPTWPFVLGQAGVIGATLFITSGIVIALMNERTRRRDTFLSVARELERNNAKLLKLDEMRQGLLAVASHDLKSPINVVSSQLMVIKDGYVGEVTDRQKEMIDKSLRRLEGLSNFISDVLSWTSIGKGELQQNMKWADVRECLLEVLELNHERLESRNIKLRIDIPEDLPRMSVAIDRIRQVFENLISNAIKYTEEGGTVTVVAKAQKKNVKFAFSDTGIGISKEDQKKLFQDFFRAPSVKKKIEGTGLGLSLVRRIVLSHRGRIWVDSVEGEGSTFYLELPLFQSTLKPIPETVFPPLFVDDSSKK